MRRTASLVLIAALAAFMRVGAVPVPGPAGFVYVLNSGTDTISAFSIDDASGTLTETSGSPFAAARFPIAAAADSSGKFLYVTNFIPGTVSAYAINGTTGALTEIAGSPFSAGAQPRSLAVDPTDSLVYVPTSSGFCVYAIDAGTGALTPIAGSPFTTVSTGLSSPFSIAVHPTGQLAYVTNFPDEVHAFSLDPSTGAPSAIVGSPFTTGVGPWSVALDPAGQFAFVSNLYDNTVSSFDVDGLTGVLTPSAVTPLSGGTLSPQTIAVHSSGQFVYTSNNSNGSVSGLVVGPSGTLSEVGGSPFSAGAAPYSLALDPAGGYAYVANSVSGTVSGHAIDQSTGELTPVAGSPFAAGVAPSGIAVVRVAPTFTYQICLQYDEHKVHKAGSTVPVKIQLCDVSGTNLSNASTTVTATDLFLLSNNTAGPLDDSGRANPDFSFRFSGGSYIFNLSTKGLSPGVYGLRFTASGDPLPHVVNFQVK